MDESGVQFTEQELRLFDMGGTFIAVDIDNVNLEDLMSCRPGGIVRCHGNPAEVISVFAFENTALGCVAGWISDEEATP